MIGVASIDIPYPSSDVPDGNGLPLSATRRRFAKEALRIRLDRLVIEEAGESKSLDMPIALNSGLHCTARSSLMQAEMSAMSCCIPAARPGTIPNTGWTIQVSIAAAWSARAA